MALIAIAAAKGSPGVSSTAAALATAWPRPALLADLDPAGGDLALRYRRADGGPLDPDRGLMSLAASVRRGSADFDMSDHTESIGGGVEVLTGVSRPEQISALGSVWGNLTRALVSLPSRDVLADCGHYLPGTPVSPVLSAADVLLFVARPTLEELFHLRERLTGLRDFLAHFDGPGPAVAVAVVVPDKDSTSVGDVQRTLDAARLRVPVVGRISDDPKAAARLRYDLTALPRRSALLRTTESLAAELAAMADRRNGT